MRIKIALLLIVLSISEFSFSQNVDSENDVPQNRILSSQFLFNAGLFTPLTGVEIGVDGTLTGDEISEFDFDETFNIDNIVPTFNANFMWRFSKKWSLTADYFKVTSRKTASIDENVEWGDLTFRAGAEVTAGFSFALYKVFFGRVISQGKKHELGGGLGAHIVTVVGFIEGSAYIDDASVGFERSNTSATLPLPNFGFWYFWAPTEKWALTARLDWFGINIGNISGVLWNVNPAINYQAFKNIGLSLNYKYISLGADVDKESWTGSFNMQFQGPSLTVTGHF